MGEEGGARRGHEQSLQERLQRTWPLGIRLVKPEYRCVQLPAQLDLPPHTVEVGDLSRHHPRWEVREEAAITVESLDPDEPEMEWVLVVADMPMSLHRPAVEHKGVVIQQGIAVGAWEVLPGDLPARASVHLGLPVGREPDDDAPAVDFAGASVCQAGRGQLSEPSVAPPGLVDVQMPAVMLPGGTAMGAPRGSAPHEEDLMALERRIVPGAGHLLAQGSADPDGRGSDARPVLHPAEGVRQIDLVRLRVCEGAVGQGCHAWFEGCVEPPLACGTRDVEPLIFQGGPQEVCLRGAARGLCGHDHRPPQPPAVQLALAHDDSTRLAQAVTLFLRQQRLTHRAHVVACQGLSFPARLSQATGRGSSSQGGNHSAVRKSRRRKWRPALGWLQ
jgi:hypothetical protein